MTTGTVSRFALAAASLVAWLYTGPLGHLAAGIADWVQLLARMIGVPRG